MDNFPTEIISRIFFFLPTSCFTQVGVVCKKWKEALNREQLWHELTLQEFPYCSNHKGLSWKFFYKSISGRKWDRKKTAQGIELSENDKSIQQIATFDDWKPTKITMPSCTLWRTACIKKNHEIRRDYEYYEIKIDICSGSNSYKICFGITTNENDYLSKNMIRVGDWCPFGYILKEHHHSWSYWHCGTLRYCSDEKNIEENVNGFEKDDCIAVDVDRMKREIGFYLRKKGQDQVKVHTYSYSEKLDEKIEQYEVVVSLIDNNKVTLLNKNSPSN